MGPALTAVRSGAATDCTLSITSACVRIPAWACEKVASDSGLGGGFIRVLWFPQLLASHELATIGMNVTKNKIPSLKHASNGKIMQCQSKA